MDSKYNKQYAIKKIKELAEVLRKNGIKIHSIFLFGSFANPGSKLDYEWSDIDVAIISESFKGSRFDDNQKLIPLAIKVEPRFELHPFTINDFENSPFAKDEIKAKGIEIR
jgi:predicted nucleotidyltransferase